MRVRSLNTIFITCTHTLAISRANLNCRERHVEKTWCSHGELSPAGTGSVPPPYPLYHSIGYKSFKCCCWIYLFTFFGSIPGRVRTYSHHRQPEGEYSKRVELIGKKRFKKFFQKHHLNAVCQILGQTRYPLDQTARTTLFDSKGLNSTHFSVGHFR